MVNGETGSGFAGFVVVGTVTAGVAVADVPFRLPLLEHAATTAASPPARK